MLNLTNAQKSCHHVFIGKADGVHCKKCGLHMSHQEYQKSLAPDLKKPARKRKGDAGV